MWSLIGIKDIVDIILIAAILYGAFRLLKRSGAGNLFWGILAFLLIWFLVSHIFHLELTGALFDRIIEVGALALIVIFQNEIRGFIYNVGRSFSHSRLFQKWRSQEYNESQYEQIRQISTACRHMSETKTGALIVLVRKQTLREYADTGERLDAEISTRMIEQIFYKNTPLHDGALLIEHGRLVSAACILPVSKNLELPKHYGLRHRAALGLTEKTDAVAIVVSEETGQISLAKGTELTATNIEELTMMLNVYMKE